MTGEDSVCVHKRAQDHQANGEECLENKMIDALERLAKLRDGGALTDEEFAQQKARLLESYSVPPKPSPELPSSPDPEIALVSDNGTQSSGPVWARKKRGTSPVAVGLGLLAIFALTFWVATNVINASRNPASLDEGGPDPSNSSESDPAYPIVVAVSRGYMTGDMCRLVIGVANMGDTRFASLNLSAIALDQDGMPIGDGPMTISNFRPRSTVTETPLFSNVHCAEIAEVKIEIKSMNPVQEMSFVGASDSVLPVSY